MRLRAANFAYRVAFRAAYPVLVRLEQLFGLRSNVAAVAVWHGDSLLLVRHSYRPGHALPGGTLGAGESPVAAAARELYEEVGIMAARRDLIPLRRREQRSGTTWLFEYRPRRRPRIVPDQREVVAAQFVPRDRLPGWIRRLVAQPQ